MLFPRLNPLRIPRLMQRNLNLLMPGWIGGGVGLPTLTNPAGALNIQDGYDVVDGEGERLVGLMENLDWDVTPAKLANGIKAGDSSCQTVTGSPPAVTGEPGDLLLGEILLDRDLNQVVGTLDAYKKFSDTLQPSQIDAHVNLSAPDTNYGSDTFLELNEASGAAKARQSFVQFDLSAYGVNAGNLCTSATLYLYLYDLISTASRTVSVYRVTATWAESTITWNNKPADTGVALDTAAATVTGVWLDWDVTAAVQAWLDGTATNYGLVLKISDSVTQTDKRFYSREYTGNTTLRPKLAATFFYHA